MKTTSGRSSARTRALRQATGKRVRVRRGPDPSREIAREIAVIASEHKAEEIAVLDLRGLSSFTDYFVICSGASDRQVEAVGEAIIEEMKGKGHRPLGAEGVRQGRWALIDYGGAVAHIFYRADREHYQLEKLWYDAPRVEFRGVS